MIAAATTTKTMLASRATTLFSKKAAVEATRIESIIE